MNNCFISSVEPSGFPLLEHDHTEVRNNMSRKPFETASCNPIPRRVLMSFMGDALREYVEAHACKIIALHHSEAGNYPLYETTVGGERVCLIQAPVGAPAAAMIADRLIHSGATLLAACGGCGVLEPISSGKILIPTEALRDEGTSYHYVSPAPTIRINPDGVQAAIRACQDAGLAWEACKTWTTDGFYRETPSMVRLRKTQGCSVVEMECAALAAVAKHYGVRFFEVLYSGDSLADPDNHDARDWIRNLSARSSAFELALRALASLKE